MTEIKIGNCIADGHHVLVPIMADDKSQNDVVLIAMGETIHVYKTAVSLQHFSSVQQNFNLQLSKQAVTI